ncbi:MAG: Gx transporter family protein [Clostridiaceae bacterium]|nr:Gx transporter family protein [Clostridiaceae bacterium]
MDGTRADSRRTRKLVLSGMIFALALILAVVENALPSLPLPGVKFGLSNIAVMYALFFLSKSQAYSIAVLKGLFVFMTRGYIAGILSLSGGILSLTVMLLVIVLFKDRVSYTVISISGAIAHNIGQFTAVSFIYTGMSKLEIFAYLPVLLVSGVVAGIVTAVLLRFVIPAFERLR